MANIAGLINELSLDNIHEQFYVFCYLLWNGYFSVDKIYKYSNLVPLDENNTIFLGSGCCRHNADLLKDVYNEIGIFSSSMPIELVKTSLNKIMDIERNIESYVKLESPKKDPRNHKICIGPFFKNSKELFMFDPTCLTECEIVENGKIICFNGKYKINDKLFRQDLINGNIRDIEFNKKLTLNSKMLKEFYEIAREICIKNKKLFEDFYIDNHWNYEKIKTLILK